MNGPIGGLIYYINWPESRPHFSNICMIDERWQVNGKLMDVFGARGLTFHKLLGKSCRLLWILSGLSISVHVQAPVNAQLSPATSTTATVNEEADEATSQPLIAELAPGKSVEFVGLTKNTAPASAGWRPDGSPLHDASRWPATIVLHNGHSSTAFLPDKPHPQPDDNALDALFRFRGLRETPSLRWDIATEGTAYHVLPIADPYKLRISTRRRGELPPGASFKVPDGEWRIGITDEPWGRYVKVDLSGNVVNPIEPAEPYAATYALIHVTGVKADPSIPHPDAQEKSNGSGIVIVAPPGQTDPEDDLHQYAFEFRAVDTEDEPHWAMAWSSTQQPNSPFAESLWGLAAPLPAGKTLSHYEYRVRPYRYWATFHGVTLEPGKSSQVKVNVEQYGE